MTTKTHQRAAARRRRGGLLRAAAALALGAAASGCGAYSLRGVVVDGPIPGVSLVNDDDPRLGGNMIPGAVVEATLDPDGMKPARLGKVATDNAGQFTLPVTQSGAGFLEYKVMLLARASGYQACFDTVRLPSSRQRVLVTMTPGRDTYRPPEDVIGESIRVGREQR